MSALSPRECARLPGWEIISTGLADLAAGRVTPNACAIAIAAPRLRRTGLLGAQHDTAAIPDAEIRLYRLLGAEHGRNAFGQYQSLLRRLVRFEHALDRLVAQARRQERAGAH